MSQKTITISDETWEKIKDQVKEEGGKEVESLDELVGKVYLFQCARYIYHGKVKKVTSDYIELTDASVVFETGSYDSKEAEDAQKLPNNIYVMRNALEAFFALRW
jgi:hypothetical protein